MTSVVKWGLVCSAAGGLYLYPFYRIVADGTHDELIETSDVYKRLYETQLLGT